LNANNNNNNNKVGLDNTIRQTVTLPLRNLPWATRNNKENKT
jgi:hypothetical protein